MATTKRPPEPAGYSPDAQSGVAGPKTTTRPRDLLYAVDEHPPWPRLLLLGLQYAILDAIYLVIVIIVLRHANVLPATATNVVSIALVASAIGTVLQALPFGPVGSGFLAPPVYSAIYLAPSLLAAESGGIPLVCGMTAFAAATELATALLLRHLRVVLQPVVSGLIVLIVGLQLGLVGLGQVLGVNTREPGMLSVHLAVAVLTFGTTIAATIWGKGILKLMATFIGLVVGLAAAFLLGLVGSDLVSAIAAAPAVRIPDLPGFDYRFDAWLIPAFLAAGLAAALRTVGVVTTCQRLNDASWSRPNMGNIRKGMFADGLGCMIGGLLGTPGMNIGPSLVGISGVSGATSRVIAPVAGGFLLLFAVLPPLATAALEMPSAVAGGLLTFTGTVMVTSGMQIIMSRPPDPRGRFVVGLSVLMALSRKVYPGDFSRLPAMLRTLTTNELAVGLLSAVSLTLVFRIRARQRATLPGGCAPHATDRVAGFIAETTEQWKVPHDTVVACTRNVSDILTYLHVGCLGTGLLHLDLWHDGLDLGVDIRYDGLAIAAVLDGARQPAIPGLSITNEEAAVESGLVAFLASRAIDRMAVKVRKGSVTVKLRFAV